MYNIITNSTVARVWIGKKYLQEPKRVLETHKDGINNDL